MKPLKGIFCLVPTIFNEQGDLDIKAFKQNLIHLEKTGMHGIVAMGSMGQYYLLNRDEFKAVASAAREACKEMICVIGTTWQDTNEVIARTKYAEDIGADGVFILPPYYSNILDTEGCYNFYKGIHDSTSKIQIMAYNYDLSGFTIDIELWDKLIPTYPRITAVKECTPIIEQGELIRRYGDKVNVIAGSELVLYPTMVMGGAGAVAVWGNAYPEFLLRLYNACVEQRWDQALRLHQLLLTYNHEWRVGGYHRDSKGTTTAAGLKGGFQRAPSANPDEKDLKFQREWLKRLKEAQ